jgi:hypothetical protein
LVLTLAFSFRGFFGDFQPNGSNGDKSRQNEQKLRAIGHQQWVIALGGEAGSLAVHADCLACRECSGDTKIHPTSGTRSWENTRFSWVFGRSEVDNRRCQWNKEGVKVMSKVMKKKTGGALIMEKYRPRMNKLTAAQRRQLRDHAMRIAFGHESESSPGSRR